MIRRFNYTNRRSLKQTDALVSMRGVGANLTFDADIRLQEYGLPADAKVYVEAYRRTVYKRFHFGTVADRAQPMDRSLADFTGEERLFFRVKVVDESGAHGRLLASADQIVPRLPEEATKDRVCLLHVEFDDLGDNVWQLKSLGDEYEFPVLLLNRNIDLIREIARSDDRFVSLVYPSVIERILVELVMVRGLDDLDGTHAEWEKLWLSYALNLAGPMSSGGTDDEKRAWIQKAVSAICTHQRIRERFIRAQPQRGHNG